MKNYYWRGINLSGKTVSGHLSVQTSQQLKKLLLKQGVALLSFKEKQNNLCFIQNLFKGLVLFKKKITLKQKVFFFEQLSLLIDSGIELLRSLEIIFNQIQDKHFKKIIFRIISDVKKGKSFAISIQEFPQVFDSYIVSLICAGEDSGKLSFVLKNISENLGQRLNILKKVKQASLLPMITLMFALMLVFGIFIFVIPQFELLFNSFDKELPGATKVVFGISTFLRSDQFLPYFLIFVLCIFILKFIFRMSFIKKIRHRFILKIYFIGKIFLYYDLIIFLQTLSMFLESGIDIQKSLNFCKTTVNNYFLRKELGNVERLVVQGKSLKDSMSLAAPDYFSADILALVEVGEQTGNLGKMLERAGNICNQNLRNKLNIVTTILQPILLVFVGLIIVLLMISVYLPIFGMAGIL